MQQLYVSKKPYEWKLVINGQSLLMTAHILRCTNRWMHACTHSLRSTKQLHTTSDLPLRQTTATLTRPPHSRVTHTAAAHCYHIQLGLQVHMYVNDLLGKWGFVHIAQCKGFVTNGITGYYAICHKSLTLGNVYRSPFAYRYVSIELMYVTMIAWYSW